MVREIQTATSPPGQDQKRRSVGELLALSNRLAEQRQRREREREAARLAEQERVAAAARETYLNALANSQPKAWLQVDTLIATKQPARYDEAVELLVALRDLGRRQGREPAVTERIRELAQVHAAKRTLLQRMVARG